MAAWIDWGGIGMLAFKTESNIVKARALNGWSLDEAAPRVGYANRGGLFKLEVRSICHDFNKKVTAGVLMNLSVGYGVSVEYLLGMTNEPELSKGDLERNAVFRSVNAIVAENSLLVAQKVSSVLMDLDLVKKESEALRERASLLVQSGVRLMEMNADAFMDLRNGANFERHLDSLRAAIKEHDDAIIRGSRVLEMKKQNQNEGSFQLSFDLLGGAA